MGLLHDNPVLEFPFLVWCWVVRASTLVTGLAKMRDGNIFPSSGDA